MLVDVFLGYLSSWANVAQLSGIVRHGDKATLRQSRASSGPSATK